MSRMSSVRIIGIAAAMSLVAAPFAIGGELPAWLLRPAIASAVAVNPLAAAPEATPVHRAAKADRIAITARSAGPMRTFSIQPRGLTDTSILVRVPERAIERDAINSPGTVKSNESSSRPRAACEPVVSVLTDVAKRLGPGRCIT